MYKPSRGDSPPNTRETTALPLENSTWHREPYNRDPRADRADRDRFGAGKRHWNGERSSNMTSFQGVPGGTSLNGNGYVPRSKPRFQGHYSGFFTESGRNVPPFSPTGPVDTGLGRRHQRNPYPSGTAPAAKSVGFSGNSVIDYRAIDTEERHSRDQYLPAGDDKEGRDQPLPPHTPQVHSDAPLLRNGDRSRSLGSRVNWENSPRTDRDNIARPNGSADIYSSRRRSIVTQLDSGKDWTLGDKRSEIGRFERYGTGSRDSPRVDCENTNKDTGFFHGWRHERGSSGGNARHSGFSAGTRSLGEIGGRGSLPVGSVHDSLHVTSLSPNLDFDQPSPSKRPRLGWGQGLAKYEKKVGDSDDLSPVAKADVKNDGEGDPCPTVDGVEKKRGVEHEKLSVPEWEHDYKRDDGESFNDAQERREVIEKKSVPVREYGAQEIIGQDSSSCTLLGDSIKREVEDERKPPPAQEPQGLEEGAASPVGIGFERTMKGGKIEKRGAVLHDSEELEPNCQGPVPSLLADDSESKRKDEVALGVRDRELLEGKVQDPLSSVFAGDAERRQGDIVKGSVFIEKAEDVFGVSLQKVTSAIECTIDTRKDLSISETSLKAEWIGEGLSRSTSLTECKTDGCVIEGAVPSSPTTHLEMIAEDTDIVSPIEASPGRSPAGCDNSPRSHIADDPLASTTPVIKAESIGLPVSSSIIISASEPSPNQQHDERDRDELSMSERHLKDAERPGQSTSRGIEHQSEEILVEAEMREEPEPSQLFVCEEGTKLLDPEPARAILQTEPTTAQGAASSDPSISQVCEKVVVTTISDPNVPQLEPISQVSLITEICNGHTSVSEDPHVLDHTGPVDSVGQAEESILETVERVEAAIDLIQKEIAQIDSELTEDVSLEICGTDQAKASTLDSLSTVAEEEDVPVPMDEDTTESAPCSTDVRVVYPSFSQPSPTAAFTRLEKSPSCSERGICSIPALVGLVNSEKEACLPRESIMTPMPEKGVLDMVPGGLQLKSERVDKDIGMKDIKGVLGRSMSQSLGSEESDFSENQCGHQVATGGISLQEHNQTMVESLMVENNETARLSGIPFVHLLPQYPTGNFDQQYFSPIEAPVWQRNVETHKIIHDRLMKKLSERHHFIKFKECVLTLRYRALNEAWHREQKGLSDRRNRPKMVGRWDGEGRCGHGPPSQRLPSRLRPLSLGRLDAESDAAQAMKTLMKDFQLEALRPVLKMPAMLLDEKEREVRKFVNKNALVENPVAVEMERKSLNLWTTEQKKIFAEKFALHNKNFKVIASYIPNKSTADCVEYYYQNHKSEEFRKSQRGVKSKNRLDYTKTSSIFLTPTAAGIKRNHEANCARFEALHVANMNMKLSQTCSHLQVLEHANPTASPSDPISTPSIVEMPKLLLKESKALEVVLPSGATVETTTSSLISTPCSVSSTAAPVNDQCKEKDSVKERMRSVLSTTRNSHAEQHPAGLKGARSTHLRRMSSRAAAQEESQWTDGERELFTYAVATYGKDFRLIAQHVGSKSQNQCKAFFSKTRKRLGLDELVEQFQANEAAAMLVQSFRHDAEIVQEVKLIRNVEDVQMDVSPGVIAEELIDTAAAVSTLESLKEQQPRCLPNDMSDLSLVADAAAVMEEITLVKSECPVLDLFSNSKSLTTSQDLACELLKVNRSTVPFSLLRTENEEDSEATKSDDSYQLGTEAETDIVVDQAAAALVGMSEMVPGLKRSKSEAKVDTKSSPVSVFSRSQSARLPTSSPPLHAVTEANMCLTSARNARHSKDRVNAATSSKSTIRDRPQDMQDAQSGRKGRETAGCEPKIRREPTSWTQEEKDKFALILQAYGKDWALLQESLPSKSLTQIKTYFQNSKARSRLPASDKLLTGARSESANRKRKADDYDSTRRSAELALPVNQKVRGNVTLPELDSTAQNEDTLLGSTSVSGIAGVGADLLAYAARYSTFPGQSADQDTLSMNGMQHSARQRVSANSYTQGTYDGHQVFRPGARPALPSPVVTRPHSSGGIIQQLSGPGPSKAVGSDLQSLSPGVVPQAGPPPAIHQVAQQVQQVLQQQQHLQKQLSLLIQQQAALPQNMLPQHQQATQQTLQAVRPLEEKLQQVVQQLQQQYELRGCGQGLIQEGEIHSNMHFQQQQQHTTLARGILKVKPIRGAASKPLDLASSPSSGVFSNQNKAQNEDIQLQQQDHSLSLGVGTIPAVTAGSTAGLQETHAKTVELQDSDTDTDCEGMGSRLMVTDDSHQRMSIVHSTSSGQQQGAAQSTTSTLSSDSEQVKSRDVKLFGQSLLSKPSSLPSSVPRSAVSAIQEFLNPNTASAATAATVTFPTGTLSKGFRTSESLPSAFGRVSSSLTLVEGQPAAWPAMSTQLNQYGAWSTTSSLQLSGVTELTKKEPGDSESAQETVTSVAPARPDHQHSDAQAIVLASPPQAVPMDHDKDDEHLDSESGNLSMGPSETTPMLCDAANEESNLNGQIANSEAADQCRMGLDPTTQQASLPTVVTGHGQWG